MPLIFIKINKLLYTDMHKISYRFIFYFSFFLISFSCRKNNVSSPSLIFINDSDYIVADRTVPVGFPIKIGVNGISNDVPITNLVITLTTENRAETALDSGIYTNNLRFVKNISYGASAWEKWTFTIMDKNRNKSSLSITLTKDSNSVFGQINYFPSIKSGCQNNINFGSFLNPETGLTYFADSINAIQNNIYIITYYASLNVPPTDFTFGSPSDNDIATYYPNINNWVLPRNEVRYKFDSLTVSPQEFDLAYNDSLIISNYTSATVGKRKFKSARPGYVIPFEITSGAMSGKRGLLKIISTSGFEDGFIEFAMKIQK